MSADRRGWQPSPRLAFATATALSVAGIALDHHSTILGAVESFYVAAYPFLQMLLGIVAGYSLCRWRLGKDAEIMGGRVDAIESKARSLDEKLAIRPTREEVNDLVIEAIREFSEAVARRYDELSRTADDRLRERVESGEISGFEARALREALALDVQPRRWLRTARDEGYVDVEDRVIGDYDRLGHFRNLVTAAETGLTSEWDKPMARYVLNPGVRDVLEEFPEVFDLVDRDDEEIARIVSECGGRPYDPDAARYKRVSK